MGVSNSLDLRLEAVAGTTKGDEIGPRGIINN